MNHKNEWMVLKSDDNPTAKLNPSHFSFEEWNGRKWRSREGARYNLVQLCSDVRLI